MKYLHTMVRVADLDASLDFYCNKLGLEELRRIDNEGGRFSLVFLAAPGDSEAQVELTYNWDPEALAGGRNFGHLAYRVDDIYALCERLMAGGVTINRPPRDGYMAFVRSPRQHFGRTAAGRRTVAGERALGVHAQYGRVVTGAAPQPTP